MVSRLVTVVSHLPDHLSGVRRDTRLARPCFYHVLLPLRSCIVPYGTSSNLAVKTRTDITNRKGQFKTFHAASRIPASRNSCSQSRCGPSSRHGPFLYPNMGWLPNASLDLSVFQRFSFNKLTSQHERSLTAFKSLLSPTE